MEEKVKCPICGRLYRVLNLNHLQKHNLTVGEFKELYPNFLLASEGYQEAARLKTIKRFSDQKVRDKMSDKLKEYNKDPEVRKTRSEGLIQYFIDNPEALEANRLKGIKQFADQKSRDEMSEIMKNSEAHKASVEKQIGGNDMVDHHIAYDFWKPEALTVKVTRKFHNSIHHPKGIPLTQRGYSLID